MSSAFCPECAETLLVARSPRCPRCATTYDSGGVDRYCGTCLLDTPPFESAVAPFLYGGAMAAAISRLKYSGATWIAAPLGNLLAGVELASRPTVIVPVPLHPRRVVERGFNQATLLAGPLARRHTVPLDTSALARVEDTAPQARQARAERLHALRGAFAVRKPGRIEGARVLLVDDVVTTTATIRAASTALLGGGASSVSVVALARAEWSERVARRGQTG